MESDFEFEYQMSLRLVHKLLSKVNKVLFYFIFKVKFSHNIFLYGLILRIGIM